MQANIYLGWLLLIGLSQFAWAENWPQWRGPRSNAAVPAGDYPIEFSPTKNVAWKVELPGEGSSTPAVWGDDIFVTCEMDGHDALCCYSREGKQRWRRAFGESREGKHRNATGANPSPVTDGERVIVYFKTGRLVALSVDGDELWRRELQQDYGPSTLWWDLGTSPIITPAGVMVAVMQNDDPYLAMFDIDTGKTVWKHPRDLQAPRESAQSYTTPTLIDTEQGPAIVVWGADHLTGHDVVTGEEIFRCGNFNPQKKELWRVIASATLHDGLAIVPYGRGKFLSAVRLNGRGDITQSNRVWTLQGVGADVPSPVVRDGRAYVLGDRGRVTCVDIAAGEKQWSDRLPKSRHKYYASPLLAGDRLYCFREDGTAMVCRVGEQGIELLAENNLDENVVALPVPLVGEGLLVRTREHLYLFRE